MAYRVPEIDGQKIACPSASGVDIKRNQVQSSNFRRTSTAKAQGTVVDNKVSINCYRFPFPKLIRESQFVKCCFVARFAFNQF